MKITISSKLGPKYRGDLVVYCVAQKGKDKPDIDTAAVRPSFKKACTLGDFKADEDDVFICYDDGVKETNLTRTAYLGVGKTPKKMSEAELLEKFRQAGGRIAAISKKLKASRICVIPWKEADKSIGEKKIYALTEGILLGDYRFTKYKTEKKKEDAYKGIRELKFVCANNLQALRKAASRAESAAASTRQARDMANEPGNSWTAESFALHAKELAHKKQLNCTVFDKAELKKMGMGGILAVNRGSNIPPYLVILEHHYKKDAPTVLLVGKGLTFDSGGISLKPAAGMEEMKYDMCGGAAVLSAMHTVGQEKPRCNVVAIIPTTDNMSGGSALKPADIIYHYNKTSSEIINTDAEGRLILADALAYGVEKYQPDYVIDLATLTGAVIIGLGHHHSGLFSNDDKLADNLLRIGKKCGEPMWRLPLGKDYKKQLDSKVADLKNTGGRPAGAITAAEYLHAFVGDTSWAHIDIAGTAWNFTEKSYIPDKGPSGVGVRTLIEFIREFGE